MDELLLKVGATPNQKAKAAGRKATEVAIAYENLTLKQLSKLKNKACNEMLKEDPNMKFVMLGLFRRFKPKSHSNRQG